MNEITEYVAAVILCCFVALVILWSDRIAAWIGRLIDAAEERTPGARPDRPPPPPLPGFTRPIELVAHDVRRLRLRFRSLPERGIAYAKREGVRRAYDGALQEACTSLGIVTLLAVLPAGPDLDEERDRVERLLYLSGFDSSSDADAA